MPSSGEQNALVARTDELVEFHTINVAVGRDLHHNNSFASTFSEEGC